MPLKFVPTLSHSESQHKYDFRDFLTKELAIGNQEAEKHLFLVLLPLIDASLANRLTVPSLLVALPLFQNLKLPQNIGDIEWQRTAETDIDVFPAI